MDLNEFIFLHEHPDYTLSICMGHGATTWYRHDPNGHEDRIVKEKYGASKVYFYEVVLLCI